ncbi:polyketide synthase dehydratase domain-containing protein, partial [Streptomyces sp. S6]
SYSASTALPVDALYEDLAAGGFAYGPVFRGVRRAWRLGDDVYADVALPETADAGAFTLHPALFDAALHAAVHAGGALGESGDGGRLPFVWDGVTLYATGAGALRVRITPTGPDSLALTLADSAGAPVATVGSLTVRAAPASLGAVPEAEGGAEDLYLPGWEGLALPEEGVPDTESVVLGLDAHDDVHEATGRALGVVRDWIGADHDKLLVVLVRDAVRVTEDEPAPDPAAAAVWGLLGSAAHENPGRIAVLDWDGDDRSAAVVARA